MADLAIHRRVCPQAVGTHTRMQLGVHVTVKMRMLMQFSLEKLESSPVLKRARVEAAWNGSSPCSLVLGSAPLFASLVGLHSDLYQA
jgi:uncharacterized membrane protein